MTQIYHYGDNEAWKGVLPNSILNLFGVFILLLRLWSRRLTKVGFGWDDVFAVLAVVLVNAMLGIFAPLVALGFGISQHELPLENITKIVELSRVMRILFVIGVICPKLSALFFYLRVFGNRPLRGGILASSSNSSDSSDSSSNLLTRVSRSVKRVSWGAMRKSIHEPGQRAIYIFLIYLLSAWSVVSFVQELTACGVGEPLCENQRKTDLGTCLFNAFGDVALFVLPLWPVWRLKTKVTTKIGLSVVFTLGVFTLVAAFERFYAIRSTDYENDYSGTAATSATFAVLELNFAIIATSLPMLLPVFRKTRDAILEPFKRSKREGGGEAGPSEPESDHFTDGFFSDNRNHPDPMMPARPRSSLPPMNQRDPLFERQVHSRERLRTPSPGRAVPDDYPLSGLEPQLPLPVTARRSRRQMRFYGHEFLGR